MAQRFNLADYETVEERLKRAHAEHDDLRIVTVNHTTAADRSVSTWIVEARIYLTAGDQANDLVKATGWAFEIDGTGMANQTSALENAETSAIGRALANMNFSGNKRATREEMEKVSRGKTPTPARNWMADVEKIKTEAEARQLWDEARTGKAPVEIQDAIKAKGKSLASGSQS
jgi:hypothetical protein